MDRRAFMITMPAVLALSPMALAQTDVLASAFDKLSPAARLAAQERLSAGGFYTGRLDGAFGPGTRSALVNAAAFIKDNSYEKVVFNLTESGEADRFLSALASGELDKYLWGEADEAEGG